MDAVPVALTGGSWAAGVRLQEAVLRPLTGRDEAALAEFPGALVPAEHVTAVLGRCVARLGGRPADEAAVRALTVGDREALLLQLHRVTFGDAMPAVVACPGPECGEKMDLELSAAALTLPPYAPRPPVHEARLPGGDGSYDVRFRLPTGEDQESAARAALNDPDAATELLLTRCVLAVRDPAGQGGAHLPPGAAGRLADRMAELDPQAELRLDLRCPACTAPADVVFDAGGYLLKEIEQRSRRLYQDVHLLAYHYHWSEREIMGMTTRKRARYLTLLDEALSEAVGA